MKGKTSNAEPWFTVSVDGLKKTLARKGKSVALYELAQNAMDTDATRIDIGLTPIENGVSILTCVDNSSSGFAQLNLAHEMYRESAKKSNPTLRGKFNLGEKFVVALCNESSITSMTGQITFRRDRTRIIGTEKTKQGTRFQGELPISLEDYEEVCNRARLLIPPQGQVITFNGEPLTGQELVKSFFITLPTEIADDEGILRPTKRKTTIRLYKVKDGEQPWLYEMGIPVVNMLDDMTYHVDVDQKVPSNTERDNVSPAYMKQVYTAVLNQTHEEITNGTAAWVSTALESTSIAPEATKAVIKARFGEKAVAYDKKDLGAENEAKSHGHTVVPRGTFSRRAWDNIKAADALPKASEANGGEFKTECTLQPTKTLDPSEYTPNMQRFEKLIVDISPLLIKHAAIVHFIDDVRNSFKGCSQFLPRKYIFTVNLAYHDPEDWQENLGLLLHEATHHGCQNNNHLGEEFWRNQDYVGARLTVIALTHPEMFAGIPKAKALPSLKVFVADKDEEVAA